jgi:two-component system, LytTR family, response regulator
VDVKTLSQIIQSLCECFPEETSVAVSNHQHYLFYQPSKSIDLKITPGENLKKGSIAKQTLLERQKVMNFVPAHVFGTPYFGLGHPIFDDQGKPIGAVALILPPEQANRYPSLPKNRFLIGQADDRFIPIRYENAAFFTSEEGQTYMHTASHRYRVKCTLQELEWNLPSHLFVRCHRSFLVNVSYILEIHRDFHSTFLLIMNDKDQTRIPVSQKYASSFRHALGF